MTQEEFYEKYGDVKVKFSYYYKYTFNFVGELLDGGQISVGCGGNADDIYKFDVSANDVVSVAMLYPYTGAALDKNGQLIDEFYNY